MMRGGGDAVSGGWDWDFTEKADSVPETCATVQKSRILGVDLSVGHGVYQPEDVGKRCGQTPASGVYDFCI